MAVNSIFPSIQHLISLPPAVVDSLGSLGDRRLGEWFSASDPPDVPLGSGGGTAQMLAEGWKASEGGAGFTDWLRSSRKMVLLGGGQGRRLPAYAPIGKPLMPVPVVRNSFGHTIDQDWLDVQVPYYDRVLSAAPGGTAAMVASGDVILRFADRLPEMPAADVIVLGMPVEPEQARHFGVFFSPKGKPGELEFSIQKPSPEEVRSLAATCDYLVDTGMWLLSERAVARLMELCGWIEAEGRFELGYPSKYELYAGLGPALGCSPKAPDKRIDGLTCAVVELPEPEFYHFGTSRQMIESFTLLQNRSAVSASGWLRHPDRFILNSAINGRSWEEKDHTLWIENSCVGPGWQLDCEHVITGAPENDWSIKLERGVCLDFVPVGSGELCIRPYGIDDAFSGPISSAHTNWFNRPAAEWFSSRCIELADAGIDPNSDIQSCPISPVLAEKSLDPGFIEWMCASSPREGGGWKELWLKSQRLSADELRSRTNVKRLLDQRGENHRRILRTLYSKGRMSVFHRLDLAHTAGEWARAGLAVPESLNGAAPLDPMHKVHDHMFRAALKRSKNEPDWQDEESAAFAELREAILGDVSLAPAEPVCNVLEDQVVWGRSPARLDLAGGWSDTPPYCLEHGGKVVNVAVNLNGQPPIQVFGRRCDRPEIVVRSIDLGVGKSLRTYDDIASYAEPGSEFALAKAVLAVAGFLPRFQAGGGYASLEEQLKGFGGGLQLSLLAAIPQGSGLGTSSILSATLLATLSEMCGLNWDRHEIVRRTLAVEQLITTGGGWQDQAGAIFGGIKLLESKPGLRQDLVVRWLPHNLFDAGCADRRILLYYTGLTRLAKGILQEIVRGMFLNSRECLDRVGLIYNSADFTFEAIQRGDYDALCEAIAATWELKQRLDSGTNPPSVQEIIGRVSDDLRAAALLGAGGGGYLLMLADDESAGARIRRKLESDPPNDRARFVDLAVSTTGLEVTRS